MPITSYLSGGAQAMRIAAAVLPMVRGGGGASGSAARQRLAQVLGQQRGVPTKVGQWLAGGEHAEDFAVCTEALPPLPWPRIRKALTTAWRVPVETVLARVEEHGHAASLGQVHRAWLINGREVAVKVQYPDIAQGIEATLAVLGLLPQVGPIRRHGLDLSGHRSMLRTTLQQELDYLHEATLQRRAAQFAAADVIVPVIIDHLSSSTVLVQSWEDGCTLVEAVTWPAVWRDRVGAALVRRFLRQIIREGLLHGDPHPGNLRVRRTEDGVAIVQYDHGCMVDIPPSLSEAFTALVVGARTGRGDPLALLAQAGFAADKLAQISQRLPALLAIVLRPLARAGVTRAADWHPGAEIAAELGADRWWFRAAGTPQLFLITRAFGGLIRQLQQLDANVDWDSCWTAVCDEQLPLPETTGNHQAE